MHSEVVITKESLLLLVITWTGNRGTHYYLNCLYSPRLICIITLTNCKIYECPQFKWFYIYKSASILIFHWFCCVLYVYVDQSGAGEEPVSRTGHQGGRHGARQQHQTS
jgi:hypothetical protein